jgi:hypothetical protein
LMGVCMFFVPAVMHLEAQGRAAVQEVDGDRPVEAQLAK